MAHLSVGDPFPNITLQSMEGPVEVRERWQSGPLAISFMRHFGCPACREMLHDMKGAYEEIASLGGSAISVFQYRPEPTRNFCRRRQVPFDCLGDKDREAYRAVGLDRADSLMENLGPKVIAGYAKGILRTGPGSLPGIPDREGGDQKQRPGTFVVDDSGTVVFAHYNSHAAANPRIDDVVEAVRQASAAPAKP